MSISSCGSCLLSVLMSDMCRSDAVCLVFNFFIVCPLAVAQLALSNVWYHCIWIYTYLYFKGHRPVVQVHASELFGLLCVFVSLVLRLLFNLCVCWYFSSIVLCPCLQWFLLFFCPLYLYIYESPRLAVLHLDLLLLLHDYRSSLDLSICWGRANISLSQKKNPNNTTSLILATVD